MAKERARYALLKQFLADGIDLVFGNPGTTEESILDELNQCPQIRYVMGLQESVVTAMADGYARVSKRPGIVQLHSAVGVGNAMAILYQASRSFTPLVVFACEVSTDHIVYDGFLGGDIAEIAKPVTKWSTRVISPVQLLRVWRRALKVAMTPPQGPVFISFPMDVLDAEIEADIYPTSFIDWHSAPSAESTRKAARYLADAADPLIFIGDGVSLANAQDEVRQLSGQLGAPVYGVDYADPNASFRDPLFMGLVGHSFGRQTRSICQRGDVILIVGTPVFPELFPVHEPYFRPGARIIHIDLNPWEIAKNFRVDVPVYADPKAALGAINAKLAGSLAGKEPLINARRLRWISEKEKTWEERNQQNKKLHGKSPLSPSEMCEVIARTIPPDTLVYDELITGTSDLLHHLRPDKPGSYYLGRGGCIGVGISGAIGAKLASPDQPVLATSGDGSALFVIQSLWTAVNQNLDITFLIANNHAYRILKINLLHYWADRRENKKPFPFMDLVNPRVDFVKIAEGFGAKGHYIKTAGELETSLKNSFDGGGVHLLDVEVDGTIPEEIHPVISCHSGCA